MREDRRAGEVGRVVAGAPDGAGEHARGDQALLGADQQLGRRAHQAVDAERPARRVLHGEPVERPPHVDGVLGAGVHVAREDDLLHVAGLDGGDAAGDDVTPAVRADGAVGVDDRAGVDGRHARADDVRQLRGGAEPGARGDRRHPRATAAAADDDLRARRSRRPRRSRSSNANEPNATGPVPGTWTSSRTIARASDVLPGPLGVGEPVGAADLDAQGLAPGHQPVAAADPGQRALGRQEVEQVVRIRCVGCRPGRRAATVRTTSGCGTDVRGGGGLRAHRFQRRPRHGVPPCRRARVRTCDDGHMSRASLDKDPHDVAAMFDGVAHRYDLTNDVISLGQDRAWRTRDAQGASTPSPARRCWTSPPAPGRRPSPWPTPACGWSRATCPSGCSTSASAAARTSRSSRATPCTCRSPTRPSTP